MTLTRPEYFSVYCYDMDTPNNGKVYNFENFTEALSVFEALLEDMWEYASDPVLGKVEMYALYGDTAYITAVVFDESNGVFIFNTYEENFLDMLIGE